MERISAVAVVLEVGSPRRARTTGDLACGARAGLPPSLVSSARADQGEALPAIVNRRGSAHLIVDRAVGRPVYWPRSLSLSTHRNTASALLDRKANPAQSPAKPTPATTHVAGFTACLSQSTVSPTLHTTGEVP